MLYCRASPFRSYFNVSSGRFFSRRVYRQPPPPKTYLTPDRVFWTIVGLNGTVFAMWQMSITQYRVKGDRSAQDWMIRNFTCSWRNISSGRVWTILTHAFSHADLMHIAFNGFGLFFMARPVLGMLGSRAFLQLYLGSAVVSGAGSLAWNGFVKHRDNGSLGASGALSATYSLLACVAPRMQFLLYGIIPIPAWIAVSGMFLIDSYSAMTGSRPGTDTAGHVAGLLSGVGFYFGRRFGVF